MRTGLAYIFTGDGKGKTSAALGVAVRAICAGMKVAWVAWYKEAAWPISEQKLPELLPIDFYLLGKGFYVSNSKFITQNPKLKIAPLKTGGKVVDDNSPYEHKQAAQAAYEKAIQLLSSTKYDVLVCDEINNAVHDQLLTVEDIKELLARKSKTHIILTGRDAHPEIIKLVDLVSEIKNIKHPYDQGISAIKGLDF